MCEYMFVVAGCSRSPVVLYNCKVTIFFRSNNVFYKQSFIKVTVCHDNKKA